VTSKKVIVITDAASELGQALVLRLARKGIRVCALAPSRGDSPAPAGSSDGSIHAYQADVSKPEVVESVFKQIIADWGRIDVLINNASVIHGPGGIGNQPIQSIDRVIDTNLKGTMYCTYCAAQSMMQQGGGYIINVASSAGLPGFGGHIKKKAPAGEVFFGDYGASKWGVIGFAEAMQEPLREHNISLTTLCPGAMAPGNLANSSRSKGEDIDLNEVVNLIAFLVEQPNGGVQYNSIVLSPPPSGRALAGRSTRSPL
jgi:NAD(P)-dependent dehydrogenase (short-subunit alcohol dehydrogenase family)